MEAVAVRFPPSFPPSLTLALAVPAVLAQPAPAELPGALTAHLREAACIHLDFTQTRTLAALSRPLKASGSMVLARDRGLVWTLRKPVAMTYVMGPKGLLVVNADGSREWKSARDAPMVAQLGRIFQALTRGDWPALGDLFTATGSGTPERWEVDLRPRPQAEPFVRRIQLDGGRAIDRVRVVEAGGDRMELVFQNQRLDAPLTEAEEALLAVE
jgi:hypothetical protein